jgi:SAM-dependent MidA family methyltransferase
MHDQPHSITDPAEVRRIARLFPAFQEFVDDALFHPAWGYYSTGKVRFGEGGHYDTFPLALSPIFGRMLAEYAYRFWRRAGRPTEFEICELGAGNGQLCLDVLIWLTERARHERAWNWFSRAFRYRIIERSPALIARQRQQIGPLSDKVAWTRADLTERPAGGAPFASAGIVFANEVLDCLSHHKIVRRPDGMPGVVFVVPTLKGTPRTRSGQIRLVRDDNGTERGIPRRELVKVLGEERLRKYVRFREVVLPVSAVPRLRQFLERHYPEFFRPKKRYKPYFACPAIEPLIHNVSRLYGRSQSLWVDYGDNRYFHLQAPETQRIFAGPPHSGATVYRAPGMDDITFLVDFSVVGEAAHQAGIHVHYYGGQGELARRSGVALDRRARDLILRYRTLGWMLAVVGVGPEREWRHTGLTWGKGKGGRMRDDINKAVAEFVGKRESNFKLMILG